MSNLTDSDRKILVELLQAGKPVPEHFKSRLFPDGDKEYVELTKVYQLAYQGKKRKEDVIAETPAAPLQEIRSFNTDNAWSNDWLNMLIFGDNLMALKSIYEDQRGPNLYGTKNRIKLVYIDPPFATKQDFMKDREKAYRDKIIGAKFIEFVRKRLILLREILADDGSIYVHLDTKKSHYIKAILDEVFGEENFRNELIWKRQSAHNDSSQCGAIHDTIFFYSKSPTWIWNEVLTQPSKEYIEQFFDQIETGTGRRYARGDLTAGGLSGGGYDYEYKGVKRIWRCPLSTMERHDAEGKLHWPKKGVPRLKRYQDEFQGVPLQDLWLDLRVIHNQSDERVGYPTQKPESLLERVIKASSNKGDIVLDAFAGSGTTLAVAEKLERRWIGNDCGKLAIYTIQKRMLNLNTKIGPIKKDERSFQERIVNFDGLTKSSKGLFLFTEKAKKGEYVISDAFLETLHKLVSEGQTSGEFILVCPEDKFAIREFEKDDIGRYIIRKGEITYIVAFLDKKQKAEKATHLTAKGFTLFHAGVYDNDLILDLDWNRYRDFVMKLFEVREDSHSINGFKVDGYIGVDPAWVWNYPDQKNLSLDEDFITSLHSSLGGRAGDRFYLIAPVVSFSFMMDEVRRGDTTYVFLKVPISVLYRLIESKEHGAIKQPISADDVNEVIDAVGFDFVTQPVVETKLTRLKPETKDLFSQGKKDYVIRLKDFRSDTLASSPDDFQKFETLSMVLVDYDFDDQVFDLDLIFWAEDLVEAQLKKQDLKITGSFAERTAACKQLDIHVPEDVATDRMLVIYIDKYGNEKKQVLSRKDFK